LNDINLTIARLDMATDRAARISSAFASCHNVSSSWLESNPTVVLAHLKEGQANVLAVNIFSHAIPACLELSEPERKHGG
jgi:hypothetical protein